MGERVSKQDTIFIGTSNKEETLTLKLANRHGLITGATGTGKTVSLQILAEGFSAAGVPVFCADIKGDLSGLAEAGVSKDFLEKRAATIAFRTGIPTRRFQPSSGTCSVSRATRSGPPSPRSDRCFSRGSWNSTTPRKAF